MSDYIERIESAYQNSVIELFTGEKLRYRYLGNFQYAQYAGVNSRGEKNSPVLENEVRSFLESSGYTNMQITEAIQRLKTRSRLPDRRFGTLVDTNTDVYNFLICGTKVKPSPEENEQDVMFFDFERADRNRFAIAEEVSYIDPLTGSHSRPDLVIYVNGIALAVIELKRSLVSIEEAVRQHLSNEKDLIPSFFTTTQFTVAASDKNGFRYATIGTPLKFWCPYKIDTTKTGVHLTDVESYLEFFEKEKFIQLFRYGVITDSGVKKIMRPHQFHALRAAIPRLEKKASGVIWHSQGSGKSLTMVWLASYIRANFEDPRVLVLTDRTELDIQISQDFGSTGNRDLHRATSSDDLLRTLAGGEEWLVFSLIHKFGNHSSDATCDKKTSGKDNIPIRLDKYLEELRQQIKKSYPKGFKAKGKNIFVFVDECHRTQGGRLHEAMREIMGQDTMLIGFTGTPLLEEDKKKDKYKAITGTSEYKFGTFIHRYLHKQAVEDKVILDLEYEARDVEQEISSKERLDQKLAEIVDGLSEERVKLIKDRWATLEKVYSSKDRIERIGYSILDDMANSILSQDWCNAMLIAGDIYSAYKYYDFFQNTSGNTLLKNRCAVITSYSPSDYDLRKDVTDTAVESERRYKYDMALQSYQNAGFSDSEQYEKWAKEKFVKQPARLKLMIVVDKLLTGFDAPCATYLYIDRKIQDHTLFQAICRVNRLGTDVKDERDENTVIAVTHKEYGFIVDFKHLFDKIGEAVTKFNGEKGGLSGYEAQDIEGLLEDAICKNTKRLYAAEKAYSALRADWERQGLTDNEKLKEYYSADSEDNSASEKRQVLYKITGALVTAYSNIADEMAKAGFSRKEADEFDRKAREASHINLYIKQVSGDLFDPRIYDHDMRNLLDRFIRANEAEVIVPATADFSFLDLIDDSTDDDELIEKSVKQAGSVRAAAEIIEAKARAVINSYKERDPDFYERFSEKLQLVIERIKLDTEVFKIQMRALLDIIKKARNGGESFPENITTARDKALWNNREKWSNETDEKKIISQIKRIEEIIDFDAGMDWKDRSSTDGILFQDYMHESFPDLNEEQLYTIYCLSVQNS